MVETGIKNRFQINAIVNFIGYGIYLGCQWLINVLVVRLSGFTDAGILALAISITSSFFVLANYNIRNYQVSDVTNEFSDMDYIGHRCSSCILALSLCVLFSVFSGYKGLRLVIISVYMIFKLSEAMMDVFQGIMQKNWRLDWVGYSYTIRGIVSILSFGVTLAMSNSLLFAVVVMCVNSYVVLFCYELPMTKSKIHGTIQKDNIIHLYKKGFGMFTYFLMFNLLTIFPRCILEYYHGEEQLGIFTSIAAPIVIIQVSATLILNPLVNLLSESYEKKDFAKFKKNLLMSLLIIVFFCTVLTLAAVLLDDYFMPLLFGQEIKEYCYMVLPLTIATDFLVLSSLAFMVLTVIRKLNAMVLSAAVALGMCILTTMLLVSGYGLEYIGIVMVVTYITLFFMCYIYLYKFLRKSMKE